MGRGQSYRHDDDDASVLTFDTFATEATDTPPNYRTSSSISSRSVNLPARKSIGTAVAANGAKTTSAIEIENANNAAAALVTPEKDAAAKSEEEVHAESSPCTFITCCSSTDAAAPASPDGDEEKAPRLVSSDAEAAASAAAAKEGAEEATSAVISPELQRAERIAAAEAESLRLEHPTLRPSPVSSLSANGISQELLSIASSDDDVGSGTGMYVFEEDDSDNLGDQDAYDHEEEEQGGAIDEATKVDDFGELLDSDNHEEEEQGGALDGLAEVSRITTSTTTTPTSIAWLAAAASASASASASRYGPEAAPKPRRDVISDAISNLSEGMNQAWTNSAVATSSPPTGGSEEEEAGDFANEESSEHMADALPRPDHLQGHSYRRDDSDAVSAAPSLRSVASSATPVTGAGTRAVSFLFDTTGSAYAPSALSSSSNAEEEDGTAAFGERIGGVELSGLAHFEPEMARDLTAGSIFPTTLQSRVEYDATCTSSIDIEVGSMGEVEAFAPKISGRPTPKNPTMNCRPSGPSDGSSGRVSRTLAKLIPSGGCSVKPVHALFVLIPIVCVLLYLCYAYLVEPNL